MMTITKRDLARKVAEELGTTNTLAYRVVEILFEVMREELIAGNRIEIRGFGVLGTKKTAPKPSARNPRTGEIIYVPARRKTYFKMGKKLKEELFEEAVKSRI